MGVTLEFSPALTSPPVGLELPMRDTLCSPHRRGHEVGKKGTEGEEGRGWTEKGLEGIGASSPGIL